MAHLPLAGAILVGPAFSASANPPKPELLSTITVSAIDWTRLESEPLRKQKQTFDVREVSDPELASMIMDASEPILRFVFALLSTETPGSLDAKDRDRLEGPHAVVRLSPPGKSKWRPRFIHERLYGWEKIGPDQLEFTVRYVEISKTLFYTDDYRFVRFGGKWLFRGHVSPAATLLQTRPVK